MDESVKEIIKARRKIINLNHILLFFIIFVALYFNYKHDINILQKIYTGAISKEIAYNIAIPDYIEIQRKINTLLHNNPDLVEIIIEDKNGEKIKTKQNTEKKIKLFIYKQNLIYIKAMVGKIIFKFNIKGIQNKFIRDIIYLGILFCLFHVVTNLSLRQSRRELKFIDLINRLSKENIMQLYIYTKMLLKIDKKI